MAVFSLQLDRSGQSVLTNGKFYWNSPRCLNTMTGDETGLASQLISFPSLPTQSMKGWNTPPGSKTATLYEQPWGFFYVPQKSEQWKSCETGPKVFRPPYPWRLECLTISKCHNKGSTFSTVTLRPWVLVRPWFEPATSRSADRRLSNWAKRAEVSFESLKPIKRWFHP